MEPERRDATSYQTAGYFIYLIFGILEVLLAFRFVLKLLGANPGSGFVDFVYNLSAIFTAPFTGIFSTSVASGAETVSVFEPATLVALAVYALLAWGIVALVRVLSGRQQE
ncbi:YggT family protein [Candidatus Saccharibacteria bacterium CG11_big_fil_rev_8_21_14_0_20_41_19]|nr:YggT family protein [Candidatus Saccharibacteria bacterium]OIP86379.1 MAG: YggT family protein [Candidatus Saccharibacteria bacterium CG2_30_41_52]PIQ71159.1 MAG: YggT family protein [Candidatus Saccharibacteria bacterium CG11_big_fil_rev_8_21_14_0_20_41_19]PIZ59973.1 MAG: YggT family protein [Candidatus Saccharibacteria bacterium CG_4_10_14_0_2_um_filter_41_11]PJC29378.1 MAG: YggT family protein [Candidatus Saccharibacteria bacterium CG_4_9_14_0_2_um_filter_41_9]PJE66144.1 MAG: YggT family